MVEKNIAVIGGGLGGLSAAIRLAANGFNVDLYEQNSMCGGKANQISDGGFRFDTGPSLLTMPFVLNELFESAGEKLGDHLEISPLDILCKYFYPDGTIINGFSNSEKFGKEIEKKTTDTLQSLKQYLKYAENIYSLASDLFLFDEFSFKNLFSRSAIKTLLQIKKIDPFRTMHTANNKFFRDGKTIQLFDRYATYNGSNPYLAPATLNIIQHVECNLGGFIVRNGIYSIVEALKTIADKNGVRIFLNHKVEKILLRGKKISGIKISSNSNSFTKNYSTIISNADVNFTYKNLLHDFTSNPAVKYSKQEPSSSALVFYFGVKGKHPQLEIHNILFSADYNEEFAQLFHLKKYPDDPSIYIYISSKFKPDDAPADSENWFVMINAPHSQEDHPQFNIENVRARIIEKINQVLKVDLSSKIIFEKVMTPADIETNTSSFRGSIYGISSNKKSAAFLRQKNKSECYSGLYFCGGSAHPGGGIPLVLLSGKITAERIIRDFA